MTQAATRTPMLKESESALSLPAGYFQRAALPWHSLVMLTPLILVYELGTRYFTTAALDGKEQQIIAFSKMQQFFRFIGATGTYMPAMALVSILIVWHVARRDSWKIELTTLAGMVLESVILGFPILLIGFVVNRYFPLIGMQAIGLRGSGAWITPTVTTDRLIMDVGAGVYEEFVFRLILFTLLSLLFKDIMKWKDGAVYLLMVAISAISFSAYHYLSPTETFSTRVFAFRALAGVYFGVIFTFRGFGITAGSHCAYDIIVTLC